MERKYLILTEGRSNPHRAKTATNVVRYCPRQVVALLDSTQRGQTSQALLGVGGDLPVVGSIAEAPTANTLLIGIALPGGEMPLEFRRVILEAIRRRMDVVSGLHTFLSDDPEFAAEARQHGVTLVDVRKNNERHVAKRLGLREECLRIHTVGNDCSVGKMVASLELALALQRRGYDAKFVATGQTGIMIAGDGIPIDCVVADFVNGAAEKLMLENQQHDILLVEGQGSLLQPSFSSVTLGLLHGCLPHGMVMCYEVGRKCFTGVEHIPLPSLDDFRKINELLMQAVLPGSRVIGVAMNSRKVSAAEAAEERRRVRGEMGLPVCDVLRDGPEELVDAVLRLREERRAVFGGRS